MKAFYKGVTRTIKLKGKRINIYANITPSVNEFITSDGKKLKTSNNERFIVRS